MSPVVFHYTNILFLSLIALVPTQTWKSFGIIIGIASTGSVGLFVIVMRPRAPQFHFRLPDRLGYGIIPMLLLRDGPGVALASVRDSPRRSICWPARRCCCSSSISATPGI